MIRKVGQRIHRVGFQHAWRGIIYSFASQPNFQIHVGVSLLVIIAMIYFPLETWERVVLIFCIVLGLVVEMVNTAIESVVDLVTGEWRQSAKTAKDTAAGAMLLTAVATSVIGLAILWPHLSGLFG